MSYTSYPSEVTPFSPLYAAGSHTAVIPYPASFFDSSFNLLRRYKNSLIYTLDVKAFKDADGNGIGDFKGLHQSWESEGEACRADTDAME
jgi:hypothetical protein